TPAEVLGVKPQARWESRIAETAIPVIAVQGGSVVGEIRFENIETPVAVKIGDRGSHACLFAAVFVKGGASDHRHIGESSVAIVVVKNAGRAVTSDINIGPAVVIKIESCHAKSVMSISLIDMRLGRNLFKPALPLIVV